MYSYLLAVFITFIIWLIFFLRSKSVRREMIVVGLILTPFVTFDILTTPVYWTPVTLYNLPVGIEGYLFTFFMTGIAAVIYQVVLHKEAHSKEVDKNRLPLVGAPAILSPIVVFALSLNPIYLFILAFIFMGSGMIIMEKGLFRNALLSSVLFAILYWCTFSIWISLSPQSLTWWNLPELSGVSLGVLPLEEFFFSLSVGGFVGPFYEFVTRARS